MTRTMIGIFTLLALAGCGNDTPKSPDSGAGVVDRTSDMLRDVLPRPLTANDVENVLIFTPIVEEGDEDASAREFRLRGVSAQEWQTVAARVSLAYAQLLMADDGTQEVPKATQLRADIEVVRPYRKRLDEMHEARIAKEAASVDRSGQMVSISRSELVEIRRDKPENWLAFHEPVTDREGFQVKPGVGEQLILVRTRGEVSPKVQRYALLPGGYYLDDAIGFVVRPNVGVK